MRGNAVCAGGFANQCSFNRIGFAAIATGITGLPQSRNVIDVDPEL
jgi:hypothetical protein